MDQTKAKRILQDGVYSRKAFKRKEFKQLLRAAGVQLNENGGRTVLVHNGHTAHMGSSHTSEVGPEYARPILMQLGILRRQK